MATSAVTVTNLATEIVPANCKRQELFLCNMSQDYIVYLGMDSNVTTANGFPLFDEQTESRSRGFGTWLGPVYGICEAGQSAPVRYWETERC